MRNIGIGLVVTNQSYGLIAPKVLYGAESERRDTNFAEKKVNVLEMKFFFCGRANLIEVLMFFRRTLQEYPIDFFTKLWHRAWISHHARLTVSKSQRHNLRF